MGLCASGKGRLAFRCANDARVLRTGRVISALIELPVDGRTAFLAPETATQGLGSPIGPPLVVPSGCGCARVEERAVGAS